MPVTFEVIRKMALALDNVDEGTSYGTPAFKVKGALMARLRDDIGALVVRMSIDDRAELMAADPETYFVTDHYLEYPWRLVRLSKVRPDAMRDSLRGAWRSAAAQRKGRVGASVGSRACDRIIPGSVWLRPSHQSSHSADSLLREMVEGRLLQKSSC